MWLECKWLKCNHYTKDDVHILIIHTYIVQAMKGVSQNYLIFIIIRLHIKYVNTNDIYVITLLHTAGHGNKDISVSHKNTTNFTVTTNLYILFTSDQYYDKDSYLTN